MIVTGVSKMDFTMDRNFFAHSSQGKSVALKSLDRRHYLVSKMTDVALTVLF